MVSHVAVLFLAGLMVVCMDHHQPMADKGTVYVHESRDGMKLGFRFNLADSSYTISVSNDNLGKEIYSDRFSDRSVYDLIPGNVWISIRINNVDIPNPLFYPGMPDMKWFNPHLNLATYSERGDSAKEICGSCLIERSFDIRDFLNYTLGWISEFYIGTEQLDLSHAREIEILAEELELVKKLEIKISCGITVLSKDDLVLRVETGWIALPPETYERKHHRSEVPAK